MPVLRPHRPRRRDAGTVHHNLLFGALLVVGVVWLFLRSLRCSLIVASVIPLALLTAFIGLQLIHLPANLISMGAIDFGILVDGAVVLVENVLHEAQRQKPKRRESCSQLIIHSAVDVARPTFFAMAIIIAALMPVFTLQRVEGRIFRPLALTYSFALLGALVFALTLVPALCAVVLRPQRRATCASRAARPDRASGTRGSSRWLFTPPRGRAGRRRRRCCSRRDSSASRLGSEFLPELDEGDIVIFVEMPPSIALDRGGEVLHGGAPAAADVPRSARDAERAGAPGGRHRRRGRQHERDLRAPRAARQVAAGHDKDRLYEAMRESLTEIPGVSFNFSQPIKDNVEEAVSGVRGQVVLKIFGTDLGRHERDARTKPRHPCKGAWHRRSRALSRRHRAAAPDRARPRDRWRAPASAWMRRRTSCRPRSAGTSRPRTGKTSGRCRCA